MRVEYCSGHGILHRTDKFAAMIDETLKKIESRIHSVGAISEDRRRELTQLLDKLKSEVGELSRTHNEEAHSIASFTDVSAHEATREKPNPQLLDLSLQGLRSSVAGLEKTHPNLFHVVNSISHTLSNLGI
jgi:hypothetical protein